MALQISYDQKAIHECTKDAMNAIRGVRSWNSPANNWQPPTFQPASSKAKEPIIPDPKIFKLLSETSQLGDTPLLPSVAECAVHLELLQALYTLRRKVLQSTELDKIFDITPQPREVWQGYRNNRRKVKIKDSTFAERRKAKWPGFINCAVVRFLQWLKTADTSLHTKDVSTRQLKELPPLDILMVWHSFLLNPKYFQRYCDRHGLGNIRRIEFPWMRIHQAINPTDWSFTLTLEDSVQFTNATNLEPDLLSYLSTEDSKSFLQSSKTTGAKQHTVKELFAAVQRQVSFVDKMEKQLWIRSPALEGTLQRAIDRYSKFLKLLKLYPGTLLVPTLDIDLVWHTHQCSASRYESDTRVLAARFIDHDDKLGTPVLDDGMEKTKHLFRIRFGREYLVCTCWDCQAVSSEVERLNRSGTNQADRDAISQTVARDVAFHRAVELARRAHKPLPMRDIER